MDITIVYINPIDSHPIKEISIPIFPRKPIIRAFRAPPVGLIGPPIIHPTAMLTIRRVPSVGEGVDLFVNVNNAKAIGTYMAATACSPTNAVGIAVPNRIPTTIDLVFVPARFTTSIPTRLSKPYFTRVAPNASEPAINHTAS